MNRNRWVAQCLVPAALLVLMGGCTGEDERDGDGPPSASYSAELAASAPSDAAATVRVRDQAFEPNEVTVSVGETVVWINEDEMGHTVTHGEGGAAAPDPIIDAPLSHGHSVSYTFDEAGTFPVTCHIHHDMQMTVVVEEQ